MTARRRERLAGEQIALQAQVSEARGQRQRVGEREHDQVVFPARLLQKGAPIAVDDVDGGVLVDVVGVKAAAQVVDGGVELDAGDVLDAVVDGYVDVGAGAGADNQLARRGREMEGLERHGVERRVQRHLVRGDDLMPDVVDEEV